MTATVAPGGSSGQVVLTAFSDYFAAFMHGSIEDLASRVSLPFFDAREGDITEMNSQAQLEGFRRGLRARMGTLGIVSATLERAMVLMIQERLALVRFENIRQDEAGASTGGTHSLAFLRRDGDAPWRVWMISVLRSYASEGVSPS